MLSRLIREIMTHAYQFSIDNCACENAFASDRIWTWHASHTFFVDKGSATRTAIRFTCTHLSTRVIMFSNFTLSSAHHLFHEECLVYFQYIIIPILFLKQLIRYCISVVIFISTWGKCCRQGGSLKKILLPKYLHLYTMYIVQSLLFKDVRLLGWILNPCGKIMLLKHISICSIVVYIESMLSGH